MRFAVWLVIGLIIYFAYGRKHSLLSPTARCTNAPRPLRPTSKRLILRLVSTRGRDSNR